MDSTIPQVAVLVLTTIAVFTDMRYGLIPNALTFPAMLGGIALNALVGGWSGVGMAALGLSLGIGFYLIPFALGGMGGGDVKLLAAIGAILGPYMVLKVFIYTALFGGLIAVVVLTRRLGWSTIDLLRGPSWRSFLLHRDGSSVLSFPYATAMWLGTLAAYSVR